MKQHVSALLTICALGSIWAGSDAQPAIAAEGQEIEIVLDVSFVDWPCEPPASVRNDKVRLERWTAHTWDERGLETAMDTVLAAGVRRIHFRSYAAGPYWPTKVPGAAPGTVSEMYATSLGLPPLRPTWKEWNMVASAAQAAHRKGIKIMAWFDLTEGHGGNPTQWALDHPQFCIVDRKGIRLDGPVGIISRNGVRLERTKKDMSYETLIREGFMKADCLRPNGTSIDPILSLAYPEVVEYRLASIREVLSFGVDGLFLVTNSTVGYEEPVSRSFRQLYDVDPKTIDEHDPRWTKHQGRYFTEFIRKVHKLVRAEEQATGRELEFVLEGQGGFPGPNQDMRPEPGLAHVPRWAFMPDFVDIETMAREKLVDGLCFWTFRDGEKLSPEARRNVKLLTRYRYMSGAFQANFKKRIAEARNRGFSCLILNEARVPLAQMRWMYPGDPGPLYELAH